MMYFFLIAINLALVALYPEDATVLYANALSVGYLAGLWMAEGLIKRGLGPK